MDRDKKAGCKLAAKSTANCSSHFCPRVAIDVQPVDRCEIKQPEKYCAGRISPPHLDSKGLNAFQSCFCVLIDAQPLDFVGKLSDLQF